MEETKTAAVAHRRPNYLLIFAALAIITALEVAVTYVAGIPKAPVLLTMSFVKAMLVVLYFMHLRSDSPWYRLIFALPFIFVIAIMLVIQQ